MEHKKIEVEKGDLDSWTYAHMLTDITTQIFEVLLFSSWVLLKLIGTFQHCHWQGLIVTFLCWILPFKQQLHWFKNIETSLFLFHASVISSVWIRLLTVFSSEKLWNISVGTEPVLASVKFSLHPTAMIFLPQLIQGRIVPAQKANAFLLMSLIHTGRFSEAPMRVLFWKQ